MHNSERHAAVLVGQERAPRVLTMRGGELRGVPRSLPISDARVSILVRLVPVIVAVVHAVCAERRVSKQARAGCARQPLQRQNAAAQRHAPRAACAAAARAAGYGTSAVSAAS